MFLSNTTFLLRMPESIGVGVGQETLVTLRVVNDGNGDDSIAVQASLDCEGWSVTPAISNLTIAASSVREKSILHYQSTCRC